MRKFGYVWMKNNQMNEATLLLNQYFFVYENQKFIYGWRKKSKKIF